MNFIINVKGEQIKHSWIVIKHLQRSVERTIDRYVTPNALKSINNLQEPYSHNQEMQ